MIKSEILKFFPEPVFKYKVDNYKTFNKELIKYIYELYKSDIDGIERSNRGGWHSKNFELTEENSIQKKFAIKIQEYILNTFQHMQTCSPNASPKRVPQHVAPKRPNVPKHDQALPIMAALV